VESSYLREISQGQIPLVFVNRRPPAPITGHFVGIDNQAAGRAVADHFIARGYLDCAVIHGPQRYAASADRLAGFRARFREEGVLIPPDRQIESALTSEAGYARACELFARPDRPRAAFCGNDSIAYGVYRASMETGLRVPDDLAILGFDDNRLNQWLAPWLSTVHVPVHDFGQAIADILQGRPEGAEKTPRTVLLPFTLVHRSSA
jgi:LacI family transcriptional regulator